MSHRGIFNKTHLLSKPGEAVVSQKRFDDVCAAHHPLVAEMMDTRRSDEDGSRICHRKEF